MNRTYLSFLKRIIILFLTVFFQLYSRLQSDKFLPELITLDGYEPGQPAVVNIRLTNNIGIYISREKALEIAKKVCTAEKWKWEDDKISIDDQGSEWKICTNINSLGMNGIINIDKRTGEVLYKFMTGP